MNAKGLTIEKHSENMILVSQVSERESSTRWRIYFSGGGCGHCIKGRGREEESRVIEIHLDCMFTGNEKEGKTWAFLFAREKVTKAVLSTVVPRKSTGDDLPKVHGVSTRNRSGVRGHHREAGQGASLDAFDRFTDHSSRRGSWMIVENSPVSRPADPKTLSSFMM